MYRKTIRDALTGIESGHYSEAAAPRIIEGLRMELGQCIELLLISSEFYAEQMELLQRGTTAIMS